jgi:uncharacterized delta-60 repeat protein
MSAGALDTTFGNGGLVTAPIQTGLSGGLGPVVVQPGDGKIVSAGSITSGKNSNFGLVRYNTDGSIDKTFGNGGVVSTSIGKGTAYIRGLALQSNGDIVAVGSAQSGFAIARYTATGSLDTTFGNGGVVVTQVPVGRQDDAWGNAIAIQPDTSGDPSKEKIYVAGSCYVTTTNTDFTLIRYNANGSLDTSFGQNGVVVTPHFGNGIRDQANALTIQADGKIVVAGGNYSSSSTVPSEMAVARYLQTNGTLDSSFGTSGIVMMTPSGPTNSYAIGVVIQSSQNNGIVVTGYSDLGLALARLTSSGQLDTTFGGSGTGFAINGSMTLGASVAIDPNGDLLSVGYGTNLAVVAYLPGGTPDVTFGRGGVATASFVEGSQGSGIAIQPSDGKIVAVGGSNGYVALARFLPPNTKIGSFTGSSAAGSVTLTASAILNSNPTSSISQVDFYLQNPDLSLTLLGAGVNNNGTWSFTFSEIAYGLSAGTGYTFVAQAADSMGAFLSDPVSVQVTMN